MGLNLLLICFVAGLSVGSALSVLPSLSYVALVCAACLFLLLLYIHFPRRVWLYLLVSGLGFIWAVYCGHKLYEQRLPDIYASKDFLVEGTVINLPEKTERGERFDLIVERVVRASADVPEKLQLKKLRLNSYMATSKNAPQNTFLYQPGQRWRLWLRLKPPRGMVNPGGFDYEGWLLQEGYSAVGYVRSSPENIQLDESTRALGLLSIKTSFDHWGFASLQWIDANIASLDQRALFAAIALGYKEEFTRRHWDMLKNTGTIHLVVVSGLNIVLAAAVGYFLLAWLSRLFFFPLYILPAPVWGAMGAIIVAVFYAGMTGLSLPTQRSLVMVLCGLMTVLLRRKISISNGFMMALVAVLVLDPLAAFTASLWLSFGAVAVLLYAFAARIPVRQKKQDGKLFITQWLYTQGLVSLGIFPILAYWMGTVPLVMPVANLFAVPFATFVLLPLTIFSGASSALSSVAGDQLLRITGWCLDLFWKFLEFMQQFNINWYMTMGNVERGDVPSALALLFSIMAIFILLSPRGVVHRYYGLLLLFPLLIPVHHKIPQGEFELTLVDVGQGLSVLVETHDTITVYDVGDRFSEKFDIGRDVVAQLIRRKGYDHVDTLIVSHADGDHAGGLEGLLGEMKANRILSGNAEIIQQRLLDESAHRYDDIKTEPCVRGQAWVQDRVRFDVLSPDEMPSTFANYPKRNNRSCVIKISNPHFSILLTGDIERDQENHLLAEQATELKADILVVPHHGSKSSSSLAFLQAIHPSMALVSLGYKSQYGHPHVEVVERYHGLGISLWRSDQLGAMTVNSRMANQYPKGYRLNGPGYWHRW